MTPKQRRAARLLARGLTRPTVAQRIGVSVRTLGYWKAEVPGFAEMATDPAEAARDPEVIEVFADLLNHSDPRIQVKAVEIALRFPDALNQAKERDAETQIIIRDLRARQAAPEEA